jgi:hypothetical protein
MEKANINNIQQNIKPQVVQSQQQNEYLHQIPTTIMIKSVYRYFEKKSLIKNFIQNTIEELYNYIYSNLNKSFDLENLEIEAKFGMFNFIGSHVYGYNFINETFKIPNFNKRENAYKYEFISGLSEDRFFSIWNYIEEESKNPQSEIIKQIPKNYKEVIYKSGKRHSLLYEKSSLIKEEIISKEDKVNFDIRNFGKDFRITICKEVKNEIFDNDIPVHKRDKLRVSYDFRFFSLDFTIVNSCDIDDSQNKFSYEIEFELNGKKIKEQNDYLKNFLNFQHFFQRFFQNVFCFYCIEDKEFKKEDSLSLSIPPNSHSNSGNIKDSKGNLNDLHLNKNIYGNLFGNYLDNNFDKNSLSK